jgi:oxygen-independent coproporphyrinogen-3 oxidase
VNTGRLPVNRALKPSGHQMLIREVVLQMKEGHIRGNTFREKFGVDIFAQFADAFANQQSAGYLTVDGDNVKLTRKGLLQVDSLLPEYFEKEHRAVRYT